MRQPTKQIYYSLFRSLKLRAESKNDDKQKEDPESEDEEDLEVPLASLARGATSHLKEKQTRVKEKRNRIKKRNRPGSDKYKVAQREKKVRQNAPQTDASASSTQISLNQTMLSFHTAEKEKITINESQIESEIMLKDTDTEIRRIESDIETQSQTPDNPEESGLDSGSVIVVDSPDPAVASAKESSDEIMKNIEESKTIPKKKVFLRRRYKSQDSAATDFVPSDTANSSRPSLLFQLINRPTRGSKITSCVSQPKKWKCPSWVSLNVGPANKNVIEHLAWDKMGVLLAVAADKWISIYDWDMVRAANMHGKNDRQRQIKDSEFKIPPILKFRVPSPVACLQWNPHNLDELAIGFRVSGHIHLYNIDRVSVWQSRKQRNVNMIPSKKTYTLLSYPRVSGSASVIHFIDPQTIFVSIGTTVYCWKLQKEQTSLFWRYQPPAAVTCVSPFGSNLLLLGTAKGHLCLLNWMEFTKEGAFSSENRPVIIQEWIPHARLKSVTASQRCTMAIVKMKVEITSRSSDDRTPWGCCRISWITTGGWMLTTILESPTIRGGCQVHHATPKVRYLNPDGSSTQTQIEEWSQPQYPVQVCVNSGLICWSDVPAVTKILPHHDKYVVSQRQVVRAKKRAVLYRDSGITHSIKLPFKAMPHSIAFHPGREWLVIGVGKELVLLSSKR